MFHYLITRPLGYLIEVIYNVVQNYGFAIILFTVLIKLILLPLNVRSQKAMRKQQKIQPIIAELQKKYENDKDKLQREMMKIYKENNVSMLGGCLPMLIQFPILIGLYQVIQRPITYLAGVADWASAEVVEKVTFLKDQMMQLYPGVIGNLANTDVAALEKTGQIQISNWASLINGSSDPWAFNFDFLGLDLSNTPSAAITRLMAMDFSDWSVILLLLIPVLAALATLLGTKITQMQTGARTDGTDKASQMTSTMNIMMPLMTGFFAFTLPSGMGVYWITSSLVQVLQQVLLNYYFDKKGDIVDVELPEKNRKNGKKR